MQIRKHHSLVLADKVLTSLRKELAGKPGDEIVVSCWSNCREQGYHLSGGMIFGSCSRLCVNIAECRSSDQVIAQFGRSEDFDGQSHQGSEKVYENQKYFNEPESAARYIAEFFLNSPLLRKPGMQAQPVS